MSRHSGRVKEEVFQRVGNNGDDEAVPLVEFFVPLRADQLENPATALDGKFTVDALTDIAELGPSDQLATLQATFHSLGQADAPMAIRDHSLFDVLYSFVKALPTGQVTRECRGLLASELAGALHKLARMINGLCLRVAADRNTDRTRFEKVAADCRSSVRMLVFLLQHTICAASRHRETNDDGTALSQSQGRAAPARGRGARGRGRGADAINENDGIDVPAKEAALTAFVEVLSISGQAIWIDPRGTRAPEVDEATATEMLKVALHLLGKHSSVTAAADDPVMENLLFLLRSLAQKFTVAYAAAVAASAPTATAAPASQIEASQQQEPDQTPASPAEVEGRASAQVAVSAAHPKNVLVGPLVELLLRTPAPTSTANTAPLPRFIAKFLALIDSEASEAHAAQYLARDDDEDDDGNAEADKALNNATSWNARFVSWVFEAVAHAALSGDITGDGSAAKNVAALIEETARNHISIIAAHAPLVMPVLCSDSYEARKAAITAISELVVQKYSNVPAQQPGAEPDAAMVLRDRYLADLVVRLRDLNPFVRSHALKTWASLVERRAVPRHLQLRLTKEAVDRVADRHFHVRRAALALLETILRRAQWFHNTVSEYQFRAKLQEHAATLEMRLSSRAEFLEVVAEARTQMGMESTRFIDIESCLPSSRPRMSTNAEGEVAKVADPVEVARVVFYHSGLEFAVLCGIALLAAVDLLASKTQFDVLQAISFIAAASEARLDGAGAAVAKMLTLVYFHEPQTQQAVCDAFLSIFFDSFNQLKAPAAVRNLGRVQKLVSVIKTASEGEVAGIERILAMLRANATSGQLGSRQISTLINDTFLDAVFGVVDGSLDERATPEDRLAAMQLYLLTVTTLLPRDVTTRKASILSAIKANAGQPRFVAVALDALSKEALSRSYVALDTSAGSSLALAPHGHPVLSAAVHELARPTSQLTSWLVAAQAACNALHALASHPTEIFASVVRYVASQCDALLSLQPGQLSTTPKFDFNTISSQALARLGQLCFLLGHSAVKHMIGIDTHERTHMKLLDDAAVNASNRPADTAAAGTTDAMQRELGMGGIDYKRHEIVERCAAARAAMLLANPVPVVGHENEPEPRTSSGSARASGRRSTGAALGLAAQQGQQRNAATRLNTPSQLWGHFAPMLVRICHAPWKTPPGAAPTSSEALELLHAVRATAVTAMTKLMVVSETFCAQQLRLASTLLSKPSEPWQVKTNLVIGLGDIACVHPNTLAPYMKLSSSGFYALLADKDVRVRAVTVQVCTHLVLNDMLRVNEHLHSIVRLVSDDNDTISHNAQLFVQHLAVKMKHNLGNVVPPLISALSLPSDACAELGEVGSQTVESSPKSRKAASSVQVLPPLSHDTFKEAMQPLLLSLSEQKGGEKERRAAESLVEKLCGRFPAFYSETDPVASGLARNLAYCLSELNFASERNMKKLSSESSYAHYKQWLRDPEVLRYLCTIAAKAKKGRAGPAAGDGDASGGSAAGADRRDRAAIDEWEQRMLADAGIVGTGGAPSKEDAPRSPVRHASRVLFAETSTQQDSFSTADANAADAQPSGPRRSRAVVPAHAALADSSTDSGDGDTDERSDESQSASEDSAPASGRRGGKRAQATAASKSGGSGAKKKPAAKSGRK